MTKRSIKSLAFIDNALPFDNVDYAMHTIKKNINWYGVPFGEKVEEFIRKKFDLLISFDVKKCCRITNIS
jgi:hypothetical protein